MSTGSSMASSEFRSCIGEKGTDEVKMESSKATNNEGTRVDRWSNDDSSKTLSRQTVTSLIIYPYSSD